MEKSQIIRKRGIYLLPNLLTTASLFAGFYAIVSAMKGHFDSAAISIFVAMIADSLDGRVARLMNAETDFGVQYDSLADMLSFGLAPALLIYCWALSGLGRVGWLAVFIYAASVALRLARFNIQVEASDKRYFKGLSCTAGAGIIASFVWFFNCFEKIHAFAAILAVIVTILVAGLMVSNIRYRSFKEIELKGRLPFVSLLLVIITFVAITLDPPSVLFAIFFLYGLSGPVLTLYRVRQIKKTRISKKQEARDKKQGIRK